MTAIMKQPSTTATVPENMRALMKARRMTQQYIADELGVSQSLVSCWVRGQNIPDVYQAAAIAKVFGVSLDVLVGARPDETRRFPQFVTTPAFPQLEMYRHFSETFAGREP